MPGDYIGKVSKPVKMYHTRSILPTRITFHNLKDEI